MQTKTFYTKFFCNNSVDIVVRGLLHTFNIFDVQRDSSIVNFNRGIDHYFVCSFDGEI